MSMLRHTPGPWHMSFTHLGKALDVGAANGDNICLVYSKLEGGSWQFVSNAALICAAPELLAALKGVLRVADRKTDEFDAARAAIAKAEGAE